MTHLKREKSRNGTTDAILNALDKKKYDGRRNITVGFKAVVERLEEVGFYNIERDIKLENLEEIDEETWVRYYSVPDRRYIYTAMKATSRYKRRLLNIETTMHQDPARTCGQLERILTEFSRHTGQHEDRLAHADGEYRQIPRILDSMKIPGMVIPTYLELKRRSEPLCDRSRRARAKMKGGKRKARRRKIAHQSRRSRLMPLWQRVAAEVRRPSRKTRRRSLRMKGFLNSSVHNATTVGKSRSNIPPTAPTHALEEDADAEAVVRREAADEDTAADTPVWTDRHQGR
ncbi:hypothetical protein RI054_20g89600 [Pseudoscourfieldia marina]